jgi:hypothetical protein
VSVVYFTDRDLGLQFPKILQDAGLAVERHRDHFPPSASDEQWLAFVGANQWVALTHNSRIRYTPNETQAVIGNRGRRCARCSHGRSRSRLMSGDFAASHHQLHGKSFRLRLKGSSASPEGIVDFA